jgi:hypothetical protein
MRASVIIRTILVLVVVGLGGCATKPPSPQAVASAPSAKAVEGWQASSLALAPNACKERAPAPGGVHRFLSRHSPAAH